jgi:alkanesulfonate monooxygenase SsuD/methylene tetrahydromethanopterin reductase-like flavin-dependent oxidoreductase (luciferase family)
MTSELNELLISLTNDQYAADDEKVQIWIIGTRDQVIHQINEFTVKRIATDRIQFMPILPVPFLKGKYMTILLR